MPPQRHQTYRLGRLFIVLQVLVLFMTAGSIAEGVHAEFIRFIDLYQMTWSILTLVAAAARSAWRWHTLVTALAIDVGVRAFVVVDLAVADELQLRDMATALSGAIVGGLWFIYFYRRRAMFSATRRWRWLEQYVPIVIGPDRYESPPPPSATMTVPPAGAFGLSQRAALLLAIAAAALLLIVYMLIAEPRFPTR